MDKNVWIINHYATNPILKKNGRHYWFAKYLNEKRIKTTIISASTLHHKNINLIKSKDLFKVIDGSLHQILVKTNNYKRNDILRIMNIINFYRNLLKTYKYYEREIGKPDIIYASSAHLLSLVAGIKIAKHYNIPCVSEVRDLWPESMVSYGLLSKNNLLTKAMYRIEKKIYYSSDQLIFTMPGAKKYLAEKHLLMNDGGKLEKHRVNILNNGLDLDNFNKLLREYDYKDNVLDNHDYFKVVYTGSIKKANKHLWELIKAAEIIASKGYTNIQIIIFGEGSEKSHLEEYCRVNNLSNVLFRGQVNSEYIPSILNKSNVNVLNCKPKEILKYGGSQNKLFQYIASGKPVITAEDSEYSLIKNINGGIAKAFNNVYELVEAILKLERMKTSELKEIEENLKQTANKYDYKLMVNELLYIFKKAVIAKSKQ